MGLETQLFGTQYMYENNQAAPAPIEHADQLFLFTLTADINARFRFKINKRLTAGILFGPSFFFRIPGKSWGEINRDNVISYYYGEGRFFLSKAGAFLESALYKNINLIAKAGSYLPVYHWWETNALPFNDHLCIYGRIGILIK